MPDNGGSWEEERRLVMHEIQRTAGLVERLGGQLERTKDDLSREIATIRAEVAVLNVKTGVWGALAGLISGGVVTELLSYMKGRGG